jgi:hypothetical protein
MGDDLEMQDWSSISKITANLCPLKEIQRKLSDLSSQAAQSNQSEFEVPYT